MFAEMDWVEVKYLPRLVQKMTSAEKQTDHFGKIALSGHASQMKKWSIQTTSLS
jgi:hypothetical protein